MKLAPKYITDYDNRMGSFLFHVKGKEFTKLERERKVIFKCMFQINYRSS